MEAPRFPQFLPIRLEHRERIQKIFWDYQPSTSELTFTNFFLWQDYYGLSWSIYEDWLIFLADTPQNPPWLFPPVGPSGRGEICRLILHWLRDTKGVKEPYIDRADNRLAQEVASLADLKCEPVRDHFDYIYRAADLIKLAGNKYHSKRNHINNLKRSQLFAYEPLTEKHLAACLNLA